MFLLLDLLLPLFAVRQLLYALRCFIAETYNVLPLFLDPLLLVEYNDLPVNFINYSTLGCNF